MKIHRKLHRKIALPDFRMSVNWFVPFNTWFEYDGLTLIVLVQVLGPTVLLMTWAWHPGHDQRSRLLVQHTCGWTRKKIARVSFFGKCFSLRYRRKLSKSLEKSNQSLLEILLQLFPTWPYKWHGYTGLYSLNVCLHGTLFCPHFGGNFMNSTVICICIIWCIWAHLAYGKVCCVLKKANNRKSYDYLNVQLAHFEILPPAR